MVIIFSNIMYMSNQLVYNGCLKCGSDSVANRVLQLPNRNNISSQVGFYLYKLCRGVATFKDYHYLFVILDS